MPCMLTGHVSQGSEVPADTLHLYSERPCSQASPSEGFAAQHNFFPLLQVFGRIGSILV